MQYVFLIEYLSRPCRQQQSFAINEIHNSTSNLVFICRSIIAAIINPDRSAEQFFNKTRERCFDILRSAPRLNTVDNFNYSDRLFLGGNWAVSFFVNIKVDICPYFHTRKTTLIPWERRIPSRIEDKLPRINN
jgi:hypothetical protein